MRIAIMRGIVIKALGIRLMIEDEARTDSTGVVQCRQRLDGMLNCYYRGGLIAPVEALNRPADWGHALVSWRQRPFSELAISNAG